LNPTAGKVIIVVDFGPFDTKEATKFTESLELNSSVIAYKIIDEKNYED